MEDILTSIRRIISDDQKAAPITPEIKFHPAEPPPKSQETSIEDDILALRTALNAIRGEVDDIRTDVASVDEISDGEAEEPQEALGALHETAAASLRDVLSSQPETLISPQAAPVSSQEALVSPQAAYSVRNSFAELAQVSESAQGPFVVETAARDMVRPMLREWLDANLPSLVERLVRQEIARIVGGRE